MSDLARELVEVVLDALDIPHAATVDDDEIRAKILDERLMHLLVSLRSIREDPGGDTPWRLAYLRERLTEHPATGYRTRDEAPSIDRKEGR